MEFDLAIPIYMQVIEAIKLDIVKGRLAPGDKMPSGRELALEYQINPNTANRVYKELEGEGICFTKRGLGTFLSEDASMISGIREEMAGQLVVDFLKGMKSLNMSKKEILALLEAKEKEMGAYAGK